MPGSGCRRLADLTERVAPVDPLAQLTGQRMTRQLAGAKREGERVYPTPARRWSGFRATVPGMALVDENYRDDGRLREQDRVRAADFLADEDRAQITGRGLPFFSGREAELGVFRRVANALSRDRLGNTSIVVEGPPGVGKSALMCQFMEEMRSLPPAGGRRRWLPVPLSSGNSESPPDIADAIDAAIVSRLARDLLASESAEATLLEKLGDYWGKLEPRRARARAREFLDRGGSVMGFSLGASREGPPKSVAQAAARRPAWQSWQIVLMIDEAQGIRPGEHHAGAGTLSALHQGIVRAPVSFCAFGLPGTLLALGDVDVSRLADGRGIHLRGLDDRAAGQTVDRCFGAFGVRGGTAWREAILARAANWPQHLAVYLNAAVRQLREASPERMDAGGADLQAAMHEGDRARARYYEQRLARLRRRHGGFEKLAKALAPVLLERGESLHYNELFDLVEDLGQRIFPPSGTNATQFIQDAEHSGFLAPAGDERGYLMPIPSFARYLLGDG